MEPQRQSQAVKDQVHALKRKLRAKDKISPGPYFLKGTTRASLTPARIRSATSVKKAYSGGDMRVWQLSEPLINEVILVSK